MAVELGPVIAVRTFLLDGEPTVIARVGLPFTPKEYPEESWCPYQIEGFGSGRVRRAIGIDSVQSLQLALLSIGTELNCSAEYQAGRLMAFPGEPHGDLGFPHWQDSEQSSPQ